jgi:hypothetical protein
VYYIPVSEKRTLSFRVDSDLAARFDEYARTHGWTGAQAGLRGGDHKGKDAGRTALLVHLIEAVVEGRARIAERAGANPFPADERVPGESPDFPALICLSPEPPVGWYAWEVQGVGIYDHPEPTTNTPEEP